jgi:hypothetical protein
MNFELTDDQELIRKSVAELAAKLDDQYWMHEFLQESYDAIAGGWLGLTLPEEYGGLTEATLLLEQTARSGGAMNAVKTPPASPPWPHVVATPATMISWRRAKRRGSPRHSIRKIMLLTGLHPHGHVAKKTDGMRLFLTRIKQVLFNQSRRREASI